MDQIHGLGYVIALGIAALLWLTLGLIMLRNHVAERREWKQQTAYERLVREGYIRPGDSLAYVEALLELETRR